MKLIKLSLAAAVCACAASSLSAADSVAEAITNGKFGGTVKTTYASKTTEAKPLRVITTTKHSAWVLSSDMSPILFTALE